MLHPVQYWKYSFSLFFLYWNCSVIEIKKKTGLNKPCKHACTSKICDIFLFCLVSSFWDDMITGVLENNDGIFNDIFPSQCVAQDLKRKENNTKKIVEE